MTTARFAALFCTCLLLAGCMPPAAQQQVALPTPAQRLVQFGYSFMPPDEPGWKVAKRSGQRLILGRFGDSRDETRIIMAGNVAAPHFDSTAAFEQYVRNNMINDAQRSGRFSVQRNELTMVRHAGTDCARMHIVSVDHQATRRSGKKGDMVLEIEQLACRHPDNAGTVTYLGYSQRYEPGHRDPQFDRKAGRLIDSLQFSHF